MGILTVQDFSPGHKNIDSFGLLNQTWEFFELRIPHINMGMLTFQEPSSGYGNINSSGPLQLIMRISTAQDPSPGHWNINSSGPLIWTREH